MFYLATRLLWRVLLLFWRFGCGRCDFFFCRGRRMLRVILFLAWGWPLVHSVVCVSGPHFCDPLASCLSQQSRQMGRFSALIWMYSLMSSELQFGFQGFLQCSMLGRSDFFYKFIND